ncbi:MAG TPA: hypothetical protein VJ870_19345 [Amycolatopsis sp.]|nr:hypothetical protein [Amycolatopsis sp.]
MMPVVTVTRTPADEQPRPLTGAFLAHDGRHSTGPGGTPAQSVCAAKPVERLRCDGTLRASHRWDPDRAGKPALGFVRTVRSPPPSHTPGA